MQKYFSMGHRRDKVGGLSVMRLQDACLQHSERFLIDRGKNTKFSLVK